MEPQRVVKVALPARTVEAMDDEIARNPAYDRATFIADAIEGLIAELRAERGGPGAEALRTGPTSPEAAVFRSTVAPVPARSSELATTQDLALRAPPPDVPTVPLRAKAKDEPTWGMHNRDWPSLWAASELGWQSVGGPVRFSAWVEALGDAAFALTRRHHDPALDLSGLPTDRNRKLERSLGRFRTFFVGSAPGEGPLFDLALAGPAREPGTVLLTDPGADLLRDLEGLEPRTEPVRDEWRAAFLAHLAAFVPADFSFLQEVIDAVHAGHDKRMELLETFASRYKSWTEQTVATNVAGFIARGREWHLIERHQEGGRYRVVEDAADALQAAGLAGEELRSRYA